MHINHNYYTEHGELAYTVRRLGHGKSKQFSIFDALGQTTTLDALPLTIYRLPILLDAAKSRTVFITEGEKDADTLHAIGLIATTNPGGCHYGWSESYNQHFRGRHCVVLADHDGPGRRHGEQVSASLGNACASICLILPFGDLQRGPLDISDWLSCPNRKLHAQKCIEDLVIRNQIRKLEPNSYRKSPVKSRQVSAILDCQAFTSLQKLLLLVIREAQDWKDAESINPPRASDLATRCSVSRESAQRNLSALRKNGWIDGWAVNWGRVACARKNARRVK